MPHPRSFFFTKMGEQELSHFTFVRPPFFWERDIDAGMPIMIFQCAINNPEHLFPFILFIEEKNLIGAKTLLNIPLRLRVLRWGRIR